MTDNHDDAALLRSMASDLAVVKSTVQDIKDRDKDHETRIRWIERRVWIAIGLAVAAGVPPLAEFATRFPAS